MTTALLNAVPLAMAEQSGLQTSFDERGLTKLAYRGIALVDLAAKKGDAFAVGGYRLGGRALWGGTGYKATWDGVRKRLTWTWDWGSVVCDFKVSAPAARLRLAITVTNTGKEALEGINIYPLGLQFPALPKGFGAPNYPQFRNGLDGVPVVIADYGKASLTLLHVEPTALYVGLSPSGAANHYRVQAGTLNDESEGFLSRAVPVNRSVAAGATDRFTIELRFGNSGVGVTRTAADVLKAYGAAWPQKLHWPDRRPIGELFLSDPTKKARGAKEPNPRNYTPAKGIDVRTEDGKRKFRDALLAYADQAVQRMKQHNAQGVLVWDLEGQQFPQPDTSFIGDPTLLPKLAPEMNAVADDFFRRFTQAGLRCGMTIRPQRLDFSGAVPHQLNVSSDEAARVMVQKIQYARKRWGCTMFYVDSDGGPNDATAPSVFAGILKQVPDVLIIPENIWPKDYAYTAPLASFTAPYKPLHTPPEILAIWPRAFTLTYVGDAPKHSLKANPDIWKAFQSAAAHGDVLTFRGWFDDQPLNREVQELTRKR